MVSRPQKFKAPRIEVPNCVVSR